MRTGAKAERRARTAFARLADQEAAVRAERAREFEYKESHYSLFSSDARMLRRFAKLCRSAAPMSKVRKAYWAMDTELRDMITP